MTPTPGEIAYTQQLRVDYAHMRALAMYAKTPDRAQRDAHRALTAQQNVEDLNWALDQGMAGYYRVVIMDRLRELALADDVSVDDGDDIDPIALHHLALSDPDAGARHGVYVGMIDEPVGYTDPPVPAAIHHTTQEQR
jgi:hypothetical protein